MAHTKINFEDRVVQYPKTYKDELGNLKVLTPNPGTVYAEGTPLDKTTFDSLEAGIYDAKQTYYSVHPPGAGFGTQRIGDRYVIIREDFFNEITNEWDNGSIKSASYGSTNTARTQVVYAAAKSVYTKAVPHTTYKKRMIRPAFTVTDAAGAADTRQIIANTTVSWGAINKINALINGHSYFIGCAVGDILNTAGAASGNIEADALNTFARIRLTDSVGAPLLEHTTFANAPSYGGGSCLADGRIETYTGATTSSPWFNYTTQIAYTTNATQARTFDLGIGVNAPLVIDLTATFGYYQPDLETCLGMFYFPRHWHYTNRLPVIDRYFYSLPNKSDNATNYRPAAYTLTSTNTWLPQDTTQSITRHALRSGRASIPGANAVGTVVSFPIVFSYPMLHTPRVVATVYNTRPDRFSRVTVGSASTAGFTLYVSADYASTGATYVDWIAIDSTLGLPQT